MKTDIKKGNTLVGEILALKAEIKKYAGSIQTIGLKNQLRRLRYKLKKTK